MLVYLFMILLYEITYDQQYHHGLTGLHVVVTMFTGYLVGFAAFRALFSKNPAMVGFAELSTFFIAGKYSMAISFLDGH